MPARSRRDQSPDRDPARRRIGFGVCARDGAGQVVAMDHLLNQPDLPVFVEQPDPAPDSRADPGFQEPVWWLAGQPAGQTLEAVPDLIRYGGGARVGPPCGP